MFARLGYYCSIDISTFGGARFNNISRKIVSRYLCSIEGKHDCEERKRDERKRKRIDFLTWQKCGGGSWPFRENVGSFETPAHKIAVDSRRKRIARKCRARTCTCNPSLGPGRLMATVENRRRVEKEGSQEMTFSSLRVEKMQIVGTSDCETNCPLFTSPPPLLFHAIVLGIVRRRIDFSDDLIYPTRIHKTVIINNGIVRSNRAFIDAP